MKIISLFLISLISFTGFTMQTSNSPSDLLLLTLENAADMDYIGEPVSQLEHALQCAHFASLAGSDEETILAALFHDIGHFCPTEQRQTMGRFGSMDHDELGAHFLRELGLSEKICQLVLGHVEAKRYLTYLDPDYYEKLSDASKETLAMQGGPMTPEEAKHFEEDPLFDAKIQMRSWDEEAKVVGLEVPPLETYREMLIRHLNRTLE